MGGVASIQGVDNTLRLITKSAVSGLETSSGSRLAVQVTVGPLDRDETDLRLNWFLYRVAPNAAYANSEPPRSGWRGARGRPPLSLELHYLLSAHPGRLVALGDGEEDQFAHLALTAVMARLHANAVLTEAEVPPAARGQVAPLVEPLRITMEKLDLETLTKLWSSRAMRLSVGYAVRLVVVDAGARHVAGPPVREPRVGVLAGTGLRLAPAGPVRLSAGADVRMGVRGTGTGAYTLDRRVEDPAGPAGGWPLTVTQKGGEGVALRLSEAGLAPGERLLRVRVTDGAGPQDAVGVTVVPLPTVTGVAAARKASVRLAVAHAAPDVEAFLAGRPMPARYISATEVEVTVPDTAPTGPVELSLRAGRVAGPGVPGVLVVTP